MSTDETRTRILDAAERLFASSGYAATSIRSITREADVNVASIHYHFGSKEAVLRGVLDRIASPINERRLELLGGLVEPTARDLIEAFVRPDLEVLQDMQRRHPSAARFAGRTYGDHAEPMAGITREQFGPIGGRFIEALAQVLPDVDRAEIAWRLEQAAAVIVNVFATYPQEGLTVAEMEHTIDRLVGFLTAAMQAPLPEGGRVDRTT